MFILSGYPRSGNTLLGAVLNVNDHIVVPEETDFIVPVCVICGRVPESRAGRRLLADLVVSTERFSRSLAPYVTHQDLIEAMERCEYSAAGVVDAVYKVVARNAGKILAGDRSPNDIGYLADFARSGFFQSDIRVIHLVRDPRDVYLSTQRLKWIPEERLRAEFPTLWASTNTMLRHMFLKTPEQYMCVRYEDLIAEPERTLTRITDFLGVPFQPKMLDPATRAGLYPEIPHHANVAKEFLTSPVGAYCRELSREIADDIVARANGAMKTFGYPETH